MKKIIFIIISLLIFRPVVPLVDYIIDYEYISEVLCINKDKPAMQCNGQCYLMQELAKVAKQEQGEDAIKLVYSSSFVLMFVETASAGLSVNSISEYSYSIVDSYNDLYSALFVAKYMRPPLV